MNEQEQKISRYLSDQMTTEELNAFKSELTNNSILAEEVNDYRETFKEINNIKLKNKLIKVSQRFAQNENKKKQQKPYYNYIGIAASLVVILIFSYMFYFSSLLTPKQLYFNHFKPFPIYGTTIRGEEDQLKEVLEFYTSGKYQKALIMLLNVPVSNNNEIKIHFFTAMSFMAVNQHSDAIQILEVLSTTNMLIQQINWYLGLSYLIENKKEKAITTFRLIKKGNFKFEEAREILEALE